MEQPKYTQEDNFLDKRIFAYEMNQEDSIDIDSEFDLICAEALINKRHNKLK